MSHVGLLAAAKVHLADAAAAPDKCCIYLHHALSSHPFTWQSPDLQPHESAERSCCLAGTAWWMVDTVFVS